VHDVALTATIRASTGMLESGGSKSSSSQPHTKPNADTKMPFAMNGSARPRMSATRFAGVARSAESVCVQRSPPIPIAIPKMPAIAEITMAFPTTKKASSSRPTYRPT
jgi:hypothetical protein